MILLVCELASAAFYGIVLAPKLAARHMDLETDIPLMLLAASVVGLIGSGVVSRWRKKDCFYGILAPVSLCLWAAALLLIGSRTGCPVCGFGI